MMFSDLKLLALVLTLLQLSISKKTYVVQIENDVLKLSEKEHAEATTSRRSLSLIVNKEQHESCSIPVMKLIKEMERKAECKPRETLIHLKSTNGDVLGQVVLNKCEGLTKSFLKCLPTKTVKRILYVKEIKPKVICRSIEVEEDIECKQLCPFENCPPHQIFDSRSCSCKCKEGIKTCSRNSVWSSSTCQCECKQSAACTTGSVWDSTKCSCVRKNRRKRKHIHRL